jgi:hypothetical protein
MTDERKTNLADPTSERTSDQSTQTAGGLTGGRSDEARAAADAREHDRENEENDWTPGNTGEEKNQTLPTDDATLKTNI